MKYVKIFGLAAVAAMALMAFVGVGPALAGGVLCSTTASPCPSAQKLPTGTTLTFSVEGSTVWETTGGTTLDTCTNSTVQSKLTANPNAIGEATGENTQILWTGCSRITTTILLGGLSALNISGSSNGTLFADKEIKVTITGLFSGENCIYAVAASADIGTLTEGNPATLDVDATATKSETKEDKCSFGPGTVRWTGTYTLTSPANTTLSVLTS